MYHFFPSCVHVCVYLGYSGLTNGNSHAEDHNGASTPPSHATNLLSGPIGRGGPIQSPPCTTGGVLQYADGPPRILPEEGQDHQGGESDTGPNQLWRRVLSSSSSSCCVSTAGTGGSTTGGSRPHHHNLAKQGYHGNHHHQSPSTQHSHPSSHVSSSASSHSHGTQEGRKRGRRKRSSAAAVSACSSPKRRSFPGLGSNGASSGSPLNINSMVRPPPVYEL